MQCEIVAVGTELLLGQIIDSNSSWMGEQLARIGIDSHYQVKVGDNRARIISTLRQALARSDAVIVCGGLGPTQDDITREAIADVMGAKLVRDAAMGEKIRRGFEARGRRFTENNLRQADCPAGASFIPEMPGTAPGLVCPVGRQVIYAVPGVPHEMRTMMQGTILPDLARRAGAAAVIRSRVLKTWGQTEARLAELLAERIRHLDRSGNPTLAFQASGIEGLKVRITAKAADRAAAETLIVREEVHVRSILGDVIFGADQETMESVVLDRIRARGASLAVAETVTGGLVSTRLTAVSGAHEVFRGGLVSYVGDRVSGRPGESPGPPVSATAARTMAAGVRERFGADIGLAVTGVAAPDEPAGHPPGTMFFGYADGGDPETMSVRLPGDRRRIREYGVISLLNWLRLRMSESSRPPDL